MCPSSESTTTSTSANYRTRRCQASGWRQSRRATKQPPCSTGPYARRRRCPASGSWRTQLVSPRVSQLMCSWFAMWMFEKHFASYAKTLVIVRGGKLKDCRGQFQHDGRRYSRRPLRRDARSRGQLRGQKVVHPLKVLDYAKMHRRAQSMRWHSQCCGAWNWASETYSGPIRSAAAVATSVVFAQSRTPAVTSDRPHEELGDEYRYRHRIDDAT